MGAHSKKKIDRFFLLTVAALTVFGFVIFLSASLGLMAQNGASFASVATNQTISLGIGIALFIIFSKINYTWLRKLALFIFLGAIGVNLLIFVPGLALHFNGASRWLDLGFITFQPSELLKISFIIYIAAWAHYAKDRLRTFRYGLLPYVILTGILTILLLAQSDTDTLVIIAGSGLIMLLIAGVPFKHFVLAVCMMAVIVGGVLYFRPYAMQRVKTFFDSGDNNQGSSYQINQSLIAIGSGQLIGRGFGQSIQKFGYLPQPTDDSIFAVAAEEFGFVGGIGLLLLYILFAASVFRIGNKAPDQFGGILAVGIGILIITESFMNMAAMLGLIPLSGMPLLFVSHGGSALMITLMTAGIVANVSKGMK